MIWKSKRKHRQRSRVEAVKRRTRGPERLEARRLFAADPIHVGVVYLETDYLESDQDFGSDSRGDRFILSFSGGAPGTELSELRIRTDKDGDGLSVGDPMFDTAVGGRGKGGAHGFEVVRIRTADGHTVDARAEVQDGGQELVLRLTNFRAGDRLEFTIDVDEIIRNSADLDVFNDRLDVITSGQEFQDSILEATFEAPHYQTAHADAIFANDFGDPAATLGLDLPPDEGPDVDSRPNRSAGAIASANQTPKPVEISGNVWVDHDLDKRREPGEPALAGVSIALWKQNSAGRYEDTGLRSTTDANGRYRFATSLGLSPGTYRLVQQQPEGYFSVGAVAGVTGSVSNGRAESANVITDIHLPLGDTSAINQDFAEAQPASIGGFVYRDLDNDGRRDAGETGIAGVPVRLVPIQTIAPQSPITVTTSANGSYQFDGLAPGRYELVELEQPADLMDGIDRAGTVDGRSVGIADNPGDRIHSIDLGGSSVGIEYNFAELPFGSLSGFVYLAAPGTDCSGDHDGSGQQPLPGVQVMLRNELGVTVAQTVTTSNGRYQFDRVPVGTYQLVETTPAGLIDGFSHAGTIGGVTVGVSIDGGTIANITMTPAAVGENYNFCEAAPASISGRVYHDASNNGRRDPGEQSIAGVAISLVNDRGDVVATQQTDAEGRYRFDQLPPGQYTVRQQQPAGYLDGIDTPGTVRGRTVGRSDGADSLTSIVLKQGDDGVDYDFGELKPGSLSGRVHVDRDGDCRWDADEPLLAGVVLRLLDSDGIERSRTTTDAWGQYTFNNLGPGEYSIHQVQPEGYFDGSVRAGSAGGVVGVNRISEILLLSGQQAIDYDFCELPPSSISGAVWKESIANQRFDPGDEPIPGVMIELIDAEGTVIKQTRTDSSGQYRFDFLAPGVYSIRQVQPEGLFHGGQLVGSAGGQVTGQDVIVGIDLRGDTIAEGYDFPEIPPAVISGVVFQDGEAITLLDPPQPNQLRDYRDGLLSEDDRRLPGVTLELRDRWGKPVHAGEALPGSYSNGPIRVTTDANGFYEFRGLRPGTYHVYQVQPDEFVDGLDTPGSSGGFAVNPADALTAEQRELLARLTADAGTDPGSDAILNITVTGGGASTDNHFSELLVIPPPPLFIPPSDPLVVPGLTEIPVNIETFSQPIRLVSFAAPGGILAPLDRYRMLWDAMDEWAVSWHLSVINGGYPRGLVVDDGNVHRVSIVSAQPNWTPGAHSKGRWSFESLQRVNRPLITLGEQDATALTGDFDGDGVDEAVIFVNGDWYVDLNGNGVWDAGDLWIQLGNEMDRPVIGDWDGDGKDDIAIFGRQWQHDHLRIIRDPGLPDPANMRRRLLQPAATFVNRTEIEEDPRRLLRRGTEGTLRADVVDHVFQYGEQVDTPVAGDWNGDGIDQVGVFRGGFWMLDADGDGRWNEQDQRVEFGQPGDEPIVGDFNGDAIDEIGVVRGDLWIIDTDGDRRLTGNDLQIRVPRPSQKSQPVVADFDGDGKDEPGYYESL